MSFLMIEASPKAVTYIAPHKHPFYEVAICTEGVGSVVIGGVEYPVHAGRVFIIPPGALHESCSQQGYAEIYIQSNHPFPLTASHGGICLEDDREGSLTTLMKMMLRRSIMGEKNDSTLLLMYELVTQLLVEKCDVQTDLVVEDVRRLLALNYNNPQLSLSQVLESTGYNKDHVRRRFLAVCGVTPGAYLTALRMEQAKKLLGRRDELRLSIAEVGARCGYYDGHYFSRVFKKHLGITPEEFEKL